MRSEAEVRLHLRLVEALWQGRIRTGRPVDSTLKASRAVLVWMLGETEIDLTEARVKALEELVSS